MKDQYDFSQGKRGAVAPIAPGKTKITISLDDEIINWFTEVVNAQNGGDYQMMINEILRAYIQGQNESLEIMLRRVLREELAKKN